ncbi:hypothetical protein GCM10008015_17860 [Flavobacterium palustre]|uniref:Outer membrane protein beta-barrel domain-containing protein n=1 Tax=Flavobacterium palustre TaxID=1476463 RepID=A0ABQ1HIZ1_9FLAO|nr:hypothetical protein [Flavobacterium palustre]GGA77596.1 hypothetical protein GCM10008015_17860 [Flavobacterium palustre]
MTKSVKTLAILALFTIGITNATAQDIPNDSYEQKFKLGIGASVGYPFEDPYNLNVGGDVRLQYDLSKRYSLTATTGFNNLFVTGEDNDLGYIPAKLGFKAFVLKDRFYLMGEAGAAFAVTNNYNDKSLLLSPSIGYATKYIDISVRYEYLPDFPALRNNNPDNGLGQVALRLAYGFKL